MSVLLDEETVILEGLDFAPPCCVRDKSHAAEVSVQCRGCGTGSLYCWTHAEEVRRHIDRVLAMSLLGVVVCATCKRIAMSFDDLAKVVDL